MVDKTKSDMRRLMSVWMMVFVVVVTLFSAAPTSAQYYRNTGSADDCWGKVTWGYSWSDFVDECQCAGGVPLKAGEIYKGKVLDQPACVPPDGYDDTSAGQEQVNGAESAGTALGHELGKAITSLLFGKKDTKDDGEAARQAAEQARADEEQRLADEDARNQRMEIARVAAEEKAKKEADFIRDRDAAANGLRGSGAGARAAAAGPAANGSVLRGSGTGNTSAQPGAILRGSGAADAGAGQLRTGAQAPKASAGAHAAWRQLHCAAALSAYAFAAAQNASPDLHEADEMFVQASRALDGAAIDVQCGDAPPFPELHGTVPDIEKGKALERAIIDRGAAIVGRMKERAAPAAAPVATAPTAPETEIEKMRRLQRELNEINSVKNTGKTQAEIDKIERDRKEMAKLAVANAKVKEGDFSSVVAGTEPEAPTRRRKSSPPPPPPTTK